MSRGRGWCRWGRPGGAGAGGLVPGTLPQPALPPHPTPLRPMFTSAASQSPSPALTAKLHVLAICYFSTIVC